MWTNLHRAPSAITPRLLPGHGHSRGCDACICPSYSCYSHRPDHTMSETAPAPRANGNVRTDSVPSANTSAQLPPEIESTLSRLSAYRNVRGVMILSRGSVAAGTTAGVVQSTGSVFEGESGKKYARVVEGLVASVGSAVAEVDEGVSLTLSQLTSDAHADRRTSSSSCGYERNGTS